MRYTNQNTISQESESAQFESLLSELLERYSEEPSEPGCVKDGAVSKTCVDAFPDETIYVKYDIGIGAEAKCDSSCKTKIDKRVTAVYCPKHVNAAQKVDLLFYFHGFLDSSTGCCATICEYLNFKKQGGSLLSLRKVVRDSGKNAILIAPSLTAKADGGKLTTKAGWEKYLQFVIQRIEECFLKQKMNIGKIILVAHSGAGKVALPIAKENNVDEVWGLDCLYGQGPGFRDLANAKKDRLKLWFYHVDTMALLNHPSGASCNDFFCPPATAIPDCAKKKKSGISHCNSGKAIRDAINKGKVGSNIQLIPVFSSENKLKPDLWPAKLFPVQAKLAQVVQDGQDISLHYSHIPFALQERLGTLTTSDTFVKQPPESGPPIKSPKPPMQHLNPNPDFQWRMRNTYRLPPVMFESVLEEIFSEAGLNHEAPAHDSAALTGDAFPKQMLYLDISIGFAKGSRVKRETAVFFPSSFDPKKPVDLLVYFHGFLASYPGNNKSIREYLNYKDCGFNCINLREEIERSGKNIILIAPTLDNKGQSGTLTHWGRLDHFLDQVKSGIAEHVLKPKFGTDKMKKGRLILSGHSGGGARLAELARHIGTAEDRLQKAVKLKETAAKLKAKGSPSAKAEKKAEDAFAAAQIKYRADEFWGFDSTYGSASTWLNTARRFPNIRLFMYYNPDGHKSKTPTFELMVKTKSKAKPGVLDSLTLVNVKDDAERKGHFRIIRPSLRERLADLQEKGDGTEWESELQFDAVTDLKKKLKKARYVQWIQYALGQALGRRISTNGKLPEVKKPLEEFRKLKGLTGTGDFDVEAETALIAISPHHPDVFLNSCVHSIIGKKDKSAPVHAQIASIAEAEFVRWGNGTIKEDDPAIQTTLNAYWTDTVKKTSKGAWSAVFVSWVIQKAGAGSFFPVDVAHSVYSFYSKLNRVRFGTLYRAYRSHEVKPGLGDVIVRPRDGSKANYNDLAPHMVETHGQIVVDVQPGKLIVIGGNESIKGMGSAGVTVNRREVKLGPDGYLPCDTKYFTVIRLDTIDRTWIHIPRIGAVPAMPEYESGAVTRQDTADRLLEMLLSRLGKCPVNPNDMVSLVSPAYAQALFGPAGKLRAELMKEAESASRMSPAFSGGLPESVRRLLNKLELHFIHDPAASTLDLLPAELSVHYKTFPWTHDDYPGNKNRITKKNGKNHGKSREMHKMLLLIRPERRPNSTENKVMSPQQFCTNKKYIMKLCGGKLMSYALQSFTAVQEAAKADGVTITVDNDFRYSTCENGIVKRTTKNPNSEAVGTFSSHMMGLAVDLNLSYGDVKFAEVTTRPFKQVIDMRTSPTHKWMFLKGALHGWYPLMPEPWHWEYNPPGFREKFWQDLEAAKPKKKPKERKPASRKPRQKEFESDGRLGEIIRSINSELFAGRNRNYESYVH